MDVLLLITVIAVGALIARNQSTLNRKLDEIQARLGVAPPPLQQAEQRPGDGNP